MIADKLGKFAHEVEDTLTSDQLSEYLAYYKIRNDEDKKAADIAANKRRAAAPRRR